MMKIEKGLINGNKKYSRENPFVYEGNYHHDYFRAIPFLRIKKMLDKAAITLDNKSVLIASCGCGIDAHYLKKFYNPGSLCFSDIETIAMEKSQSVFPNESFVLVNNEQLAFKDNAFDYVLVAASLHHLREPVRGLYELLRVAKHALIVIEPNDTWLTRMFEKLGFAEEYEVEHGNYVYRFDKRGVDKINKALLFKCYIDRFFSIHRVAKNKIEFTVLKLLNSLANIIYPGLGNYIIFTIIKERQPVLGRKKSNEK